MSKGIDLAKVEAALKRAAHKALYGTHEERSGRFLVANRQPPRLRDKPRSTTVDERRKAESIRDDLD